MNRRIAIEANQEKKIDNFETEQKKRKKRKRKTVSEIKNRTVANDIVSIPILFSFICAK